MIRALFVGNLESDTRESDLERLFRKYGKIEQVDLKSGFAFVYFEKWRDAEEAIRGTNKTRFGYQKRKLFVEWAKTGRGKPRGGSPKKTLIVMNLDPIHTKESDIERKFEPYGKVISIHLRRDFAFVQFAKQEDANKALDCTHSTKILDRIVLVEYAVRNNIEREDRHDSPSAVNRRRRSNSPVNRRRRSNSPVNRRRSNPRSPEYDSPDQGYDRDRSRSPVQRAIRASR